MRRFFLRSCVAILLSLSLANSACCAVDFAGDADSVNDSTNLGMSDYPISFYVLVRPQSLIDFVWSFADSSAPNRYFTLEAAPGADGFLYAVRLNHNTADTPGFSIAKSGVAVSNNVWYKVVCVSSANNSHSVYVSDGNSDTDVNITGFPTTVDIIGVGAYLDSSPAYGEVDIAEFAVWGVALGAQDRNNLLYSNLRLADQIQPTNLNLYWRLDDHTTGTGINGTTFRDLSVNGNDGTGVDADADSSVIGEEVLSYPSPILGN